MEYRVEDKYLIYEDQIAFLKTRLSQIMEMDAHAKDGGYLIRSVYFDDYENSCLFENESGVDRREKYRIRTYNNDTEHIKLERKAKLRGFTQKYSETISIEDARILTKGNALELPLLKEDGFLKKKFYADMCTRYLHSVVIVEYERSAFVDTNGNVRITFDRNIGATRQTEDFFEECIPTMPVLRSGQHILEVKYDEFLPDVIRSIIDTGSLQKTSFSKYYYSLRGNMV